MKTIILAFGCFALLAASRLVAADSVTKPFPVEQRLREIDLTIALHQYEKVQTELADVRLTLFMSEREGSPKNEKALEERGNPIQALRARQEALQVYSQMLREEIRRLGGESSAGQAKKG